MIDIEEPLNDGSTAVENSPDSEETSPYGDKNENLPDHLVNALKSVVMGFRKQEMYDRRREVIRDRRNRYYERGHQHVYPDEKTGFFSSGSAGTTISVGNLDIQLSQYLFDWNIFTPSLDTIVAVLTQNSPGIDFLPNNPDSVEDVEAAETAEGYRKAYDRLNDTKGLQTKVMRMFGLSGRTVLWTRTIADEQRFGTTDDGSPRRMQTTTVYGTLESKVPVLARSLTDAPYCFLFNDPDIKLAKQEFPQIRKEIKAGEGSIAESIYERTARLGVLQGSRAQMQTGDVLTHMVTVAHCFLRPAAFVDLEEDSTQQELEQLFPKGCRVTFVGEQYAESVACSMDDEVAIGFPYDGEGMDRRAIMDPAIVLQDSFNDAMNGTRELFDHAWPTLWVNADDQELAAILSQKSEPGAIRGKKVNVPDASMPDQFFREPDPTLSPAFIQYVENIQGELLQFILATPPAIFGGATPDNKTAAGMAQAHAQALGRLGLIWGSVQALFASMYRQAALAAANDPYTDKQMVVPGQGANQPLQLDKISKGHFGAFPDTDSSFPETTGAQRQTLTQLFTMAATTPLGSQIFNSPKNWELIRDTMGTPDLFIQQAESRQKQEFELELLLKTAPVPPSQEMVQAAMMKHAEETMVAQASGMPPPPPFDPMSLMQPSVPIDPECDFNQFEWETVQEWLSGEECRQALAQGNQQGVMNVRLHGLAHKAAAQAEMAQQMAMMPQPAAPAPHGGGKPPAAGGPQGGPQKKPNHPGGPQPPAAGASGAATA